MWTSLSLVEIWPTLDNRPKNNLTETYPAKQFLQNIRMSDEQSKPGIKDMTWSIVGKTGCMTTRPNFRQLALINDVIQVRYGLNS